MVGFGCIGQGVLPLPLRHIEIAPEQILIIARDRDGDVIARAVGVQRLQIDLTAKSLRSVPRPRHDAGDFPLNISLTPSRA